MALPCSKVLSQSFSVLVLTHRRLLRNLGIVCEFFAAGSNKTMFISRLPSRKPVFYSQKAGLSGPLWPLESSTAPESSHLRLICHRCFVSCRLRASLSRLYIPYSGGKPSQVSQHRGLLSDCQDSTGRDFRCWPVTDGKTDM